MDDDQKAFSIPWTPLLALVAHVGGLATLLPSRSARPPVDGMEVAFIGSKGVSARLWQDPLQVANEAETRRRNENQGGKTSGWLPMKTGY